MSTNHASQDLCTACGLCCSGAQFNFGPLDDDEVESARQAGLDVHEANGKMRFRQPCSALKGTVCTAYEVRPQTCRTYECSTLIALQSGEIDQETAFERVHEARQLFEALQSQLTEGTTIPDVRRMRAEAGQADPAATPLSSPILMIALGMLDVVLDQYFRTPEQRQIVPVEEDS